MERCLGWLLLLISEGFRFPTQMELMFLGNKYISSNEPHKKPLVLLQYMGKRYETSRNSAFNPMTVLTYRGVSYCK